MGCVSSALGWGVHESAVSWWLFGVGWFRMASLMCPGNEDDLTMYLIIQQASTGHLHGSGCNISKRSTRGEARVHKNFSRFCLHYVYISLAKARHKDKLRSRGAAAKSHCKEMCKQKLEKTTAIFVNYHTH